MLLLFSKCTLLLLLEERLLLGLKSRLRLLDLPQLLVLAGRFLFEAGVLTSDLLNFLFDAAEMLVHGLHLILSHDVEIVRVDLSQRFLVKRLAVRALVSFLSEVEHVFVDLVNVVSFVVLRLVDLRFLHILLVVMTLLRRGVLALLRPQAVLLVLVIISLQFFGLLAAPVTVFEVIISFFAVFTPVVIRGPLVLVFLVGVDEVHCLDDRALSPLGLGQLLAIVANLREMDECADAEAVRFTRAFLDLGRWAGLVTLAEIVGAVLGVLVLVVDEAPLFLVRRGLL